MANDEHHLGDSLDSRRPSKARTMNQELMQFVDHARDKGMDHATIRLVLLSAGWKEKQIA